MKQFLRNTKQKNRKSKLAIPFFLFISFFLCVPISMHAESKTEHNVKQTNPPLRGTILDKTGEAIIGATVKLKGSPTVGTVSDVDGKFTLNVPKDGILQISYIGFTTTEIAVNGKTEINIILEEDSGMLDEVVVVGYGVQKKVSVTGSVAAIKSDELMNVKAPNVTNMLAGRLPGLRAVQRSGSPGDDGASVDIRGYGDMLVIVDGVERDYSQLDANDIESISILKDASAAVYGFKGANGVLLVTTKSGTKDKPKINYNGYYGFQQVTRYPELMDAYEYASLYNEAIYNSDPWRGVKAYDETQLKAFKDGSVGTKWWDSLMRNSAPQTSHNMSVTGGNDRVTYYTSIGLMSQEGLLESKDWNYKRYNIRSNIDIEVAKGFNVEVRLGGRYDIRKRPYNADDLFRSTQMAIPIYPIYANNNSDYWQAVGGRSNPAHVSSIDNGGYENRMRRELNSSISLTWKLPWVQGLIAKATIAYDYTNTEWKAWQKAVSEYTYDAVNDEYIKKDVFKTASLESKIQNYYKPTYQYSLNYNQTFGKKHDIGALLLWEMYNDRQTYVVGFKENSIGLLEELEYGDAAKQSTSGNTVETAHAGLVGRFNYAYDNRYLLEFNCRYDGTYKFRRGDRWGFFPGVSLGWRISEEAFFKNMTSDIDNLKIRASYAKIGDEGKASDYPPFQYLDGYQYGGSYIMGSEGLSTGLVSKGMANPWLTWYESKTMNLGFEASFRKGLLAMEFDFFRRHRTGLLDTRKGSLPTTFGESMPLENLNSDKNIGFEFSLSHRHNIGDFRYNISSNFSSTRIKWDHHETSLKTTNMYNDWRNNKNGRYQDIRWGKKAIGVFQSYEEILNSPIQDMNGNKTLMPGDIKFEDYNQDGLIDGNDDQPIGRGSTPLMYYGLNLGAEYKGFDLTVFFQGAAGHDIYIKDDVLDTFIQQALGNGFAIMTNRWHRADPTDPYSEWISGAMPVARIANINNNKSDNTWTLHKADYLRLKTLELGYTIPSKLTKSHSIERVRFYVNCNNLLTFTNTDGLMKYIDPESNNKNLRYYPQVKTYNFGVSVTF